jgi:hypothetical protein
MYGHICDLFVRVFEVMPIAIILKDHFTHYYHSPTPFSLGIKSEFNYLLIRST